MLSTYSCFPLKFPCPYLTKVSLRWKNAAFLCLSLTFCWILLKFLILKLNCIKWRCRLKSYPQCHHADHPCSVCKAVFSRIGKEAKDLIAWSCLSFQLEEYLQLIFDHYVSVLSANWLTVGGNLDDDHWNGSFPDDSL